MPNYAIVGFKIWTWYHRVTCARL